MYPEIKNYDITDLFEYLISDYINVEAEVYATFQLKIQVTIQRGDPLVKRS